jgi:hypothetical protein
MEARGRGRGEQDAAAKVGAYSVTVTSRLPVAGDWKPHFDSVGGKRAARTLADLNGDRRACIDRSPP